MPDIDIDFPTNFSTTKHLKCAVPASMVKSQRLVKHNCGHYFQDIPIDAVTGIAAIPYEEAEVLGYFKIDFLHLSVLDDVTSKEEIRNLLKKEPNWDLLLDEDVVSTLFHVRNHYALLNRVRPRNVQALADCLALIRPNKRLLLEDYIKNPASIRKLIYRAAADDKSAFKRCHAIAYALTIVLQLHLHERASCNKINI